MRSSLFLSFLLVAFLAQAQKAKLPADVKAHIEKRIEYGMSPSIVVGIIDENGPVYFSFGKTEAGGAKVTEHSIYEIGSISKTFTATLLADQIIKGKMQASDPAQTYLPADVKMPMYEGQSITLGHLSDHTSSLPRLPSNMAPADLTNPYADYTLEQLYSFLSSYTLPRPIGSEFEYSNLAVGLLGHILSLQAGKSYEELLVSTITRPLGMNETKITLDENMKRNLAAGHSMGERVANWDLPTLAGAGAIRSSVYDMLRYVAVQLDPKGTPLSKAIQLTHVARHDKANGARVGLGWLMKGSGENEVIWHNGGTGGYRTFAGFSPLKKMGVVVMTNSDAGVDEIGFRLLDPNSPLSEVKEDIIVELKNTLDKKGPAELAARFSTLKASGKYEVDEMSINGLGYHYLQGKKIKEALAIFEINMNEFPSSFNVYDSYAEALMEDGQKELAIRHYKKSLELNPGNSNGVEMLAKMGVEYAPPKPQIDEALLESYTGTYQLAPGFNIVITRKEMQLIGQATGQSAFELYPKSENEFYLTVTEARAVFNVVDGKVVSMTWYQGGQVFECPKLQQ